MFSHIMLGSNDLEASKTFYDAILGTLGYEPGVIHGDSCVYATPTGIFILKHPSMVNLPHMVMAQPLALRLPLRN